MSTIFKNSMLSSPARAVAVVASALLLEETWDPITGVAALECGVSRMGEYKGAPDGGTGRSLAHSRTRVDGVVKGYDLFFFLRTPRSSSSSLGVVRSGTRLTRNGEEIAVSEGTQPLEHMLEGLSDPHTCSSLCQTDVEDIFETADVLLPHRTHAVHATSSSYEMCFCYGTEKWMKVRAALEEQRRICSNPAPIVTWSDMELPHGIAMDATTAVQSVTGGSVDAAVGPQMLVSVLSAADSVAGWQDAANAAQSATRASAPAAVGPQVLASLLSAADSVARRHEDSRGDESKAEEREEKEQEDATGSGTAKRDVGARLGDFIERAVRKVETLELWVQIGLAIAVFALLVLVVRVARMCKCCTARSQGASDSASIASGTAFWEAGSLPAQPRGPPKKPNVKQSKIEAKEQHLYLL